MAVLPSEFSIRVPEAWSPLPLDRDEARAAVDDALRRWEGDELSPDEQSRLKAVFGRLAVEAREAGVVFGASYVDVLDEVENPEALLDEAGVVDADGRLDPEAAPRSLLSAVVTLSTASAAEISPTGLKVTEQSLLQALETPPTEGARQLRPPATAELPAGHAVRTEVIEPFTAPEMKGAVPLLAITYHLPLAGGEALAVLSFRTPCLALGEEFRGLFHAIAGTLEFSSD